jgi:transcription initiation factor IIE alpha subunit
MATTWNNIEISSVVSALKTQTLKTKVDIFRVFRSLKISKKDHLALLNRLKEKNIISYSRRRPVGYLVHDHNATSSAGQKIEVPSKFDERAHLLNKKVPDRLKKSKEQVDQTIKEREEIRQSIKQSNTAKCPRCSGKMNVRPFRCGQGRVVQISVCSLCNYNIPLL